MTDGAGRPFDLRRGDVLLVTGDDPALRPLSLAVPELSVERSTRRPASCAAAPRPAARWPFWPRPACAATWPTPWRKPGPRSLRTAPGPRTSYRAPPDPARSRLQRAVSPARGPRRDPRALRAPARSRARRRHGLRRSPAPASPCGSRPARPVAPARPAAAAPHPDGRYGLPLTDAAGGARRARRRPRSRPAELGDPTASLTLPELDLTVDWDSGRISGTGPTNTRFQWLYPARRCFGGGDPFVDFTIAMGGFSGESGAIAGRILPFMNPGEGMTLELPEPSGHRVVYRDLWRALVEVHVGAARITGNRRPRRRDHRHAAGRGRQRARHRGDDRGPARRQLRADLPRGIGGGGWRSRPTRDHPARRPASELGSASGSAATGGGEASQGAASPELVSLLAEPLSFDWAAGQPVEGNAPPNRALTVQLRLADGRSLRMPRTSDADGRFSLTPNEEVPPRADWRWSDIAAVRVCAWTRPRVTRCWPRRRRTSSRAGLTAERRAHDLPADRADGGEVGAAQGMTSKDRPLASRYTRRKSRSRLKTRWKPRSSARTTNVASARSIGRS